MTILAYQIIIIILLLPYLALFVGWRYLKYKASKRPLPIESDQEESNEFLEEFKHLI